MERISSGFRFTGGMRIGLLPAIWTDTRSRSWAANSSWDSPNSLAEVSASGWPFSVHKMTATRRGAMLDPPLSTTWPTKEIVPDCGRVSRTRSTMVPSASNISWRDSDSPERTPTVRGWPRLTNTSRANIQGLGCGGWVVANSSLTIRTTLSGGVKLGSLAAIEYTLLHMPQTVAQGRQPLAMWVSISRLVSAGPTPRAKSVQTSSEKCFTDCPPYWGIGSKQ